MTSPLDMESLSKVLGGIYTAAIDGSWGEALLGIGKPINAHGAQLAMITTDAENFADNVIVGDFDVATAEQHFAELIDEGDHIRANFAASAPELRTFTDRTHTTPEHRKRSRFYQEHAIPLGLDFYGGTVIERSANNFVVSVMLRESRYGDLKDEELQYLDLVAPHVRTSLELARQAPIDAATVTLSGLFQRLRCAAFLIDDSKKIHAANDNALEFFSREVGINDFGGSLSLQNPTQDRLLTDQIRSYSSPDRLIHQLDISINPERHPMLKAVVIPYSKLDVQFSTNLFLVLIIDRANPLKLNTSWLVRDFGLTRSEAHIAKLLVDGCSIREIAVMRNASIETVRTQFRRASAKLGTNKQSEFIMRLVSHYAEQHI